MCVCVSWFACFMFYWVILNRNLKFLEVFVVTAQGYGFDFVFIFIDQSCWTWKPISSLVHHFQVLYLLSMLRAANSVSYGPRGVRHILSGYLFLSVLGWALAWDRLFDVLGNVERMSHSYLLICLNCIHPALQFGSRWHLDRTDECLVIDSFFGLVVLDRDVVILVFRSLAFGDLTQFHVSIFIFFFIRNIISVGLDFADRVQIILPKFICLILNKFCIKNVIIL